MRLYKSIPASKTQIYVESKLPKEQSKSRKQSEYETDRDSAKASASFSIYCWGHGGNGRLGTGDLFSRSEPCLILHTQCQVKGLACGSLHTLLLLEDSRVFAWGEGQSGQLGLETVCESVQPCLVSSLLTENVTEIAAGGLSSAAGIQMHQTYPS